MGQLAVTVAGGIVGSFSGCHSLVFSSVGCWALSCLPRLCKVLDLPI